MRPETHLEIEHRLCGAPCELSAGFAAVELVTVSEMKVDGEGLVHGGFVFGLADHAAMLAVNHPHVVLGAADVRFLRPVRDGARLRAEATVEETKGKKHSVRVRVLCGEDEVLMGILTCFVLDRHVLAEGG
jgi:uncharacterized protein (TIGR00369 family)